MTTIDQHLENEEKKIETMSEPLVSKTEILSIELPLADSQIQTLKQLAFLDGTENQDIDVSESIASCMPTRAQMSHQAMSSVLIDDQLMSEMSKIPDRLGFKIGDVADLLGIKQYILRYWEQEFEILRPKKASNNQRLYTKKDVENTFLIRKLLYRDKFSIEGARQAIKDVKFAFNKEKNYNLAIQKIDQTTDQVISSLAMQIKGIASDLKKLKNLF